MSEIEKIVLTSCLTVFGSVTIFVLGQVIVKWYIDPIDDLLKCIGKTNDILIYYANLYLNPGVGKKEKMDEAEECLRKIGAELRAKNHRVKTSKLFLIFEPIPTKENINKAASYIIGLSNSINNGKAEMNSDRVKKIEGLLNIIID